MYKMAVLSKNQIEKPIEKPKVKRLKNIDRLAELPFYEQLNVIKTNKRLEDMQCHTKLK